jgi:hypothetical protein
MRALDPVWTHCTSGTPAFNCVALFSFALTLTFCYTSYDRLLMPNTKPRGNLRPAVFASSAANGFHLNNPHTAYSLKKAGLYKFRQ